MEKGNNKTILAAKFTYRIITLSIQKPESCQGLPIRGLEIAHSRAPNRKTCTCFPNQPNILINNSRCLIRSLYLIWSSLNMRLVGNKTVHALFHKRSFQPKIFISLTIHNTYSYQIQLHVSELNQINEC